MFVFKERKNGGYNIEKKEKNLQTEVVPVVVPFYFALTALDGDQPCCRFGNKQTNRPKKQTNKQTNK